MAAADTSAEVSAVRGGTTRFDPEYEELFA